MAVREKDDDDGEDRRADDVVDAARDGHGAAAALHAGAMGASAALAAEDAYAMGAGAGDAVASGASAAVETAGAFGALTTAVTAATVAGGLLDAWDDMRDADMAASRYDDDADKEDAMRRRGRGRTGKGTGTDREPTPAEQMDAMMEQAEERYQSELADERDDDMLPHHRHVRRRRR